MKKFSAILLAVLMMLSMTAMAATINVTGVVAKEYSAYQIFAIEKNDTTSAEIFTIESDSVWFDTVKTALGDTLVKRNSDASDKTWGVNGEVSSDTAKGLAAALKTAYDAMETKPTADATAPASAEGKATMIVDNAGYYFVTSSLGALCMMDTANDTANVEEKNGAPTVDKKVEGQDAATADIGKELTYTATITVADANPTNYVYHDAMSDSLTFSGVDSVSVTLNGAEYTDFEVKTTTLGDECDFHVVLKDGTFKMNDVVVITYKATINEKALTVSATNDADLTYGENGNATNDSVTVKTGSIVIDKYATNKDDAEDKSTKLANAQFVLKNADGKFYSVDADGVVTWVDNQTDATVRTTDTDGKATFAGVADGTYNLVEIAAPAGYNLLTAPVSVNVTSNEAVSVSVTASVGNSTGSSLPSTGGMGTTLFYVVGSLMMAAAVVVLVAKKKVAAK